MAGESNISLGDIESRAENLETKVESEKAAAEKVAADKEVADKAAAAAKEAPVVPETKKEPNDPVELRKWATRTSMEVAELKKIVSQVADTLNKNAKKKVDYVALAKDPAKLEAAIAEREKEIQDEERTKAYERINSQTADITNYEDQQRFKDTVNYPRWAELKPLMMKLAEPRADQPNGDPRVDFNRHPKLILDDLYTLAQQMAANDPNYKKPAVTPAPVVPNTTVVAKTYTQEEMDAQIAKAVSDAAAGLKNEAKGGGVGSMGKGGTRGAPGAVDKEVLKNMPMADLKAAIMKASPQQ